MVSAEQVKQWIEAGFADSMSVQVQVSGSDGRHFEATVVGDVFKNMPLVQRHRLVYQALGDHMHTDIHALSLHTRTLCEI